MTVKPVTLRADTVVNSASLKDNPLAVEIQGSIMTNVPMRVQIVSPPMSLIGVGRLRDCRGNLDLVTEFPNVVVSSDDYQHVSFSHDCSPLRIYRKGRLPEERYYVKIESAGYF